MRTFSLLVYIFIDYWDSYHLFFLAALKAWSCLATDALAVQDSFNRGFLTIKEYILDLVELRVHVVYLNGRWQFTEDCL